MVSMKNVPVNSDLHEKLRTLAKKNGMTIIGLANRWLSEGYARHQKKFTCELHGAINNATDKKNRATKVETTKEA